MKPEKLALLEDALRVLEKATEHLGYSMDRVQALQDKSQWTLEELELVPQGSLLDRIERAEKRGWIAAPDLVRIRELRNLIAHEYVEDKLHELHLAVLEIAPLLIELTPKVAAFGRVLIVRYGGLGAVS